MELVRVVCVCGAYYSNRLRHDAFDFPIHQCPQCGYRLVEGSKWFWGERVFDLRKRNGGLLELAKNQTDFRMAITIDVLRKNGWNPVLFGWVKWVYGYEYKIEIRTDMGETATTRHYLHDSEVYRAGHDMFNFMEQFAWQEIVGYVEQRRKDDELGEEFRDELA